MARGSFTTFLLTFGTLVVAATPGRSEPVKEAPERVDPLGPVDNPSSLAQRGYQSRPCGFDFNHNGIVGEESDCNVCDAALVDGKLVANTLDPDGDGTDEDLIYVDCDAGSNFGYCGRPGFRPCATIEYAWNEMADGPGDGAEDIVCFSGTCSPEAFLFPVELNGLPDHWTKAREGSETRDWQFPSDPAMLVGWDRDDDGEYPPFDGDDIADLDGTGARNAFALNYFGANSYYEIAHFRVRDYGNHDPTSDGGGFLTMFATLRDSTHGFIHDLSLRSINKDAGLWSGNISFSWFNSARAKYVALTNIESLDEGGYTFRGSASIFGGVVAGPWRFQNLSIRAHGCDLGPCSSDRAQKMVAKLWGWVDGVEFLDSSFDANVRAWSEYTANGIVVSAFSQDWDIVNNELLDWVIAIVGQADIPDSYGGTPRYTDDIVIKGNLFKNEFRDGSIPIYFHNSGGNGEAIKDSWILNNTMTSSLEPKAFIMIRQGNSDGPCVTNVRVANNTFFGKAKYGLWVPDPMYEVQDRFKRLKLRNNIFAGLSATNSNLFADYVLDYLDADFNIYDADAKFRLGSQEAYSIPEWRSLTGLDTHSIACLPAFRSKPFDLRLVPGDTCAVDRGSSLAYLTSIDFEGDDRPFGSSWDIGADEWNGGFFWDSFETGALDEWTEIVGN